MAELPAQLRRGEGVLLTPEEHEEEFFDLIPVDELAVVVSEEELIQVKGRVHRLVLILQHDAAAELIIDHGPQLIREHLELREALIGVVFFPIPAGLCILLIRIGPVEDLLIGKLISGKLFEGRAGQIQRVGPLNVIESLFGLVGLHAFLRLIHDKEIEGEALFLLAELIDILFGHPAQLGELAAEVLGALQILQGDKGDHAFVIAAADILVPCQDAGLPLQGIRVADKAEIMLPADEFIEVFRPGVCDAGPVGDDEHPFKTAADDEVIGAERLAEAGLGVPEELPAAA